MIWALAAAAAPIVHPDDVFVVAVGSDPHADNQHWGGFGEILTRFGLVGAAMGADASMLLGDIGGLTTVDGDGDRVADCVADRVQSPTCPWPSPWLAELWRRGRAVAPDRPLWAIGGNHDGHAPAPIDGYRRSNQWWTDTVAPFSELGVVDTHGDAEDHYEVRVQLPSGTWSLLMVGDAGWRQDRAVGGRCDERDLPWFGSAYTRCSTLGWPEGVIADDQLRWLEVQIAAAAIAGRHVVVATHQPPPHTVVLTDAPGQGYAVVCPPTAQFPSGITVQGTTMYNYPRDADILPARADLDSPGPRETAHEWVATLLRWQAGSAPDDQWGLELARRYPGVVRLWLSGHNHIPVPDLTYAGRGVRYTDAISGTTWLAQGALGAASCATVGACRSQQATRLELHGDGTWAWQRWAVQSSPNPLPQGCATSATLPGSRPAPWGGLAVETGP